MDLSQISEMRFACGVAARDTASAALADLLVPIDRTVTPGAVDVAFLFFTAHFADQTDEIIGRVSDRLPNCIILGCTAEGTIGANAEFERTPSISLLAASLPDVAVRPFHLTQAQLQTATRPDEWERMVGVSSDSKPVFIAFADPFSVDIHAFIDNLNTVFPAAPLFGGVASAAHQPRENRLIVNGNVHREGLVGVALTGRLQVSSVVSQGCRPIGKPFVITRGDRNIVHELGGKPALEQLQSMLSSLPEADEQLARQSMFVGRVIDEFKGRFGRGDFLIHNIVGADRKSGAIGIAGHAKMGATVQFHVRDADSADEDLRLMLAPYAKAGVRGALLFGCNGRGTHMWPEPGHDIGMMRQTLGNVPTAGFFCGGEFGPVGKKNFVHGFTASIALFREPTK
ncbi:MAG: FIST C-terminal domain-containing protein [Planctomycetes bacterium]|nr:FIST C-terminal domain-containing protein [Planctomycetota bacterium]MBI3834157.1 FIST C-terminal domain-containing protein [Planctomycetota bacterium]